MALTRFSGPVRSTNGFQFGADGTQLTFAKKGTVQFTVSALAAAAEEDLTASVSGLTAGDVVMVTPRNAAMETGLALLGAWVSAADTLKIRVGNVSGSTLTGGANTWDYIIFRS